MAFADIPPGRYFKLADGETATVVFIGEPEHVTNNFGERQLTLTILQLHGDDWVTATWGISKSTAITLQTEHRRNGGAWAHHAYELTRRGALKDTRYSLRPSPLGAPTDLVPLTKIQIESGKWDRGPIAVLSVGKQRPSGTNTTGEVSPAPMLKMARMRDHYRKSLSTADEDQRNEVVDSYGDADTCADRDLSAAIDALLPF